MSVINIMYAQQEYERAVRNQAIADGNYSNALGRTDEEWATAYNRALSDDGFEGTFDEYKKEVNAGRIKGFFETVKSGVDLFNNLFRRGDAPAPTTTGGNVGTPPSTSNSALYLTLGLIAVVVIGGVIYLTTKKK